MSDWKLTVKSSVSDPGTTKTFAEWNLGDAGRSLSSQGIDQFSFNLFDDYDADLPFEKDSICIVTKVADDESETKWFWGVVAKSPKRVGSGQSEIIHYTLAGPSWYLDQFVFQQYWRVLIDVSDPEGGYNTFFKSHLMLGQQVDGTRQGLLAQITEIVQYAIDAGAPIALGVLDVTDMWMPLVECKDMTCLSALVKMLRWLPDCSVWWDYTATVPTINIRRRGLLTAATLNIGDGTSVNKIELDPRDDLVRPSVVFKFERTNEANGAQYAAEPVVDAFPVDATGRELGALVATIGLEGQAITTTSAPVTCATINESSVAWWKTRIGKLNDANVTDIVITSPVRETALPRHITNGSFAEWMIVSGDYATCQKEKITAHVSYKVTGGDNGDEVVADELLDTDVSATDLVTGNYSTIESLTPAEATPTGMAEAIYNALSVLHYDGSFTIVDEEVDGAISIGNVVNLTGGRAEWATMNAQVQRIDEDIDLGTTVVTVGTPRHLGEGDIMELLRETRTRFNYTNPRARSAGVTSSSRVQLSKEGSRDNSGAGLTLHSDLPIGSRTDPGIRLTSTGAAGTAAITLRTNESGGTSRTGVINISSEDNPDFREIKLREFDVSLTDSETGDCVEKKMLLFCSEPYDP